MAPNCIGKYYGYLKVFMDGAKQPQTGKVAAPFVVLELELKQAARLLNDLSVFSAEAIIMANQ